MPTSTGEPTFLEIVRNAIVTYKGTVGDPVALSDVAKLARVEPITLISSNLNGTTELYNILHGILNIYAAYYLQAVGILSAQLTDIRILKILDKTNPDRDIKTLLGSGYTAFEDRHVAHEDLSNNVRTLTLDDAKFKLPMLHEPKPQVALENIFDEDDDSKIGQSIKKLDTFEKLGTAIGKVIEVHFTVKREGDKDAQEIVIPVVVKLDTMIIPSEVINSITVSNTDEITFGSRLKDAITGRIRFIKDFILCSDLIKSQKKSMIKDPTGYYAQLLKRINNSRIYSTISGNISVAGVSSIIVLSETDEQEIQRHIGGKLSNVKTRDIVFSNTSAMMIVVVDNEWERVSIYVKDIDSFSQNNFSAFKSMADKGNNNIQDILKAFALNNSPSF